MNRYAHAYSRTRRSEMALSQLAVLTICSFLFRSGECLPVHTQCINGFIGIDTLIEKAALVGNLVRQEKKQMIFPAINFTCTTTVSGWNFVAENRAGRMRKLYPELQIWRATSAQQYSRLHRTSTQQLHTTEHSNVFRYSGFSVQVQAGDMLGVFQPDGKKSKYTLIFQEGGGPTSYRMNAMGSLTTFNVDSNSVNTDYPLVGVETSNSSCLHGFLDMATLRAKGKILAGNPSGVVERTGQQRVFPGINFTCNGTLKKWTFAAEEKKEGAGRTEYPHFQIWRHSSTSYDRVGSSTLQPQRTRNLNVYEYVPGTPLGFQVGDILGIYQPSDDHSVFTAYYEVGSGLPNYRTENQNSPAASFDLNGAMVRSNQNDFPLVTVEISADCGPPPRPNHGSVHASSTTSGSRAVYTCNSGYRLDGPEWRECQVTNGQWSDRTPTCRSVDCGVPPSIQHGTISYMSTTLGSVAGYHCDEGFLPSGTRRRTCEASGQWSGRNITCQGIYCDSLHAPQNGSIFVSSVTPGTDLDSTAEYSCDDKYRLVGQRVRMCQASGQWTGEPPVCERIYDCGRVQDPENGWVNITGVGRNAIAEYYCSEGYRLVNGSPTRTCGEEDQWTGIAPMCAVDCGSLSISHGAVVVETTTLGSVALYSCDRGFTLVGSDSRTCEANGRWSGEEPLCMILIASSLSSSGPTPSSHVGETTPKLPPETPRPTSSVGTSCHWDGSELGRVQNCNSKTAVYTGTLPPEATPPPEGSLSLFQLVIGAIIAIIFTAILFVCGAILVVYVRHKKYQNAAANISVENPTYTGDTATLNSQSCIAKEKAAQQEAQQSQTAEAGIEGAHYYDSADLYDQPVCIALNRGSPCREKPPAINTQHLYELASVPNSPHYETASLSTPYEVPVSPYEIPTPKGKAPNIYSTLHWGIYVPTEEQRRSSTVTSAGMYAAPSRHSDQQVEFFEESEIYWRPASDSASLYEQLARNKYREILRHQIQITEHLGSGQFGTVDKGLWQAPGETMEVAVKTLKTGSEENDRVKFLQEAAINGQFQHPNVVKLHGVVTVGEPVMIVLELLVNGDLRNYLIKNRPSPGEMVPSNWPETLVRFCKDIALGMEYLARKAFVHRDLAARNILVAEDRVCKISDFGLSRDLEEENYYISNGGKIPVKWTAPEALHFKKYSTASDVWSYGTVMYEIWSLGHKPFEGYTNPETIKAIDQGMRLHPPPGCPLMIYELMIQCWHPETSSRPTFTQLLQALSSTITDLLSWSEEDMRVHPQAAVLGASLEAGKDLYPELQGTYLYVQEQ